MLYIINDNQNTLTLKVLLNQKKISEYDQEIPQSQTADKLVTS